MSSSLIQIPLFGSWDSILTLSFLLSLDATSPNLLILECPRAQSLTLFSLFVLFWRPHTISYQPHADDLKVYLSIPDFSFRLQLHTSSLLLVISTWICLTLKMSDSTEFLFFPNLSSSPALPTAFPTSVNDNSVLPGILDIIESLTFHINLSAIFIGSTFKIYPESDHFSTATPLVWPPFPLAWATKKNLIYFPVSLREQSWALTICCQALHDLGPCSPYVSQVDSFIACSFSFCYSCTGTYHFWCLSFRIND